MGSCAFSDRMRMPIEYYAESGELKTDTFYRINHASKVDLSNGKYEPLTDTITYGSVDTFILSGNGLEELPHTFFARNNFINRLDLSRNSFARFSYLNEYNSYPSIDYLDLSRNKITDFYLNERFLVTTLNLSHNQLKSFESGELRLANLVLSDNPLESVLVTGVNYVEIHNAGTEKSWFTFSDDVKSIYLDSIIALGVSLDIYGEMDSVKITNSIIGDLDFGYSSISSADLSGSHIKMIVGDLPKKLNLESAMKELETDKYGLFEFQPVEELNIARNDLKDISFVGNSDELQKLDASGNQIEDLVFFEDEYHYPNKKLMELDLSRNKIRDISSLTDFPKLKVLDLSENRIKSLVYILYNPDLRELDLSFNLLHDVPDEIRFLKKLEKLNLSGNPMPTERIEQLRKQMPKTTIIFDSLAKRSFEDKGDITVFMKGLPENEYVTISLQDEKQLILGLSNGQLYLYDKIIQAYRLLASFSNYESVQDLKWIGRNEFVFQTEFSGTYICDLDDFSIRLITEWPGEKISVFRKQDGFLLYYGNTVAGFGKFIGDELGEFSYEKDINHLSTSLKRTTILFLDNEVWWMVPGTKEEEWKKLEGVDQRDALFFQLEGAIVLARADSSFVFYEDTPLVHDLIPVTLGNVVAAAKNGDDFFLLNDESEIFKWNKTTGEKKIRTVEGLRIGEMFREGISLHAVNGSVHLFCSENNTLYSVPMDPSLESKSMVLHQEKGFDHFTLDTAGKNLFLFTDGEVSILHLNSGVVRKESDFTTGKITSRKYVHPEFRVEFSNPSGGKSTRVFDEKSLKFEYGTEKAINQVQKTRVKREADEVKMYSKDGKNKIGFIPVYDASNFDYINSGDTLLITTQEFEVEIHRLGDTSVIKENYFLKDDPHFSSGSGSKFCFMEQHGNLVFVFWEDHYPFIYDIKQKKQIPVQEMNFALFTSGPRALAVSGNTIAVSGLLGDIRVFTLNNDHFEYVSSIELKDSQSTERIALDASRNLLYVMSADKDIDIYRYEKYSTEFLMSVIHDSEGILILDDEMNYMGKPASAEGLKFSYTGKVYSLESFSQLFNQPAKILRDLGYADEKFLNILDRLREKKVSKAGKFSSETLYSLPEMNLNSVVANGSHSYDTLTIHFRAKIQHDTLDYAVIYQNGVPIKKIQVDAAHFSAKEMITLVPGRNLIGVQVVARSGVKSLIEEFQVDCKIKSAKPDLYFLGIGADQFAQSSFNLEFPAKDVRDFANSFSSDTIYHATHLNFLTGKDVTVGKVKQAVEELKKTAKNDVVIIYFAGHGVFNGDLDYFLATHDMDFAHPENKGLSYDTLIAWMNQVTSIRRVLFMDACHSGELDKEEYKLLMDQQTSPKTGGTVKFRNSGSVVQTDQPQAALEMAREYFSTFGLSSGWNIIGSSSGVEYSMETAELKNGLFTYYLIQDKDDADLNKDGEIDLEEWMTLVTKDVQAASQGKQSPQFRERNRRSNFKF